MITQNFKRYLILLVFCFATSECFVQITSGTLNGTSIISAQVYRKGDDFSSFFDPIYGVLVNESSGYIDGNIVVLNDVGKNRFWYRIIELKDLGAIAVINLKGDKIPGREFCTYTGQDAEEIGVQVISVYRNDFAPVVNLMNSGEVIEVIITSEGNQWSHVIVSAATQAVSRAIFGAASVGLIAYGLYKLIMFIKAQGPHFNVPQVCLALEIIAHFWRILSSVVDPLGCFQMLPTAFSLYVNSAAIPFGTATFVLVTFYWHEIVTDASISIHPFLSRLQIPFFVITITLLVANVIIVLTSFYLDFGATVPFTITFLVISFGFLVFYVITAIQINMRMKASNKIRRVKRLNRVNSKMILNAVSRFCGIITAIAFALCQSDPVSFVTTGACLGAMLLFDSFARIFLFDVPRKNTSSNSKSMDATEQQAGTTINATTQKADENL